ncbi:MAG TPA: DUF420 domain-containing protein [Actinobacteria bacterium]|nr:DUF420 domain-containing protein [Actinomycetota bacterium]
MSGSLSTILFVVHVLLIALLSSGFVLALRGRGTVHHRVMLTLYILVSVYVPVYLTRFLAMPRSIGFQSPISWVYYLYLILAAVHIIFLAGALFLGWQTIQIGRKLAKIGPRGHYFSAGDHAIHATRGQFAIAAFAGVAVTGLVGDVFNFLTF